MQRNKNCAIFKTDVYIESLIVMQHYYKNIFKFNFSFYSEKFLMGF